MPLDPALLITSVCDLDFPTDRNIAIVNLLKPLDNHQIVKLPYLDPTAARRLSR